MNGAMWRRIGSVLTISLAVMFLGCHHAGALRPTLPTILPSVDRSVLAGEWDYAEAGGAVVLRLDAQGNGSYDFKDGRFETMQFDGHRWIGKWYQKENDRDGGFLVNLSADWTEGDGTWWYDRIGANSSPSEKGGTFRLSRKTSVTSLNETPPAP